jgi:cytochrome c-type biogenesis protein CcmH/NrfG
MYLWKKNYTEAVEAYKNALRNDPDDETRYNYALAKKMLKENPPKDDKE